MTPQQFVEAVQDVMRREYGIEAEGSIEAAPDDSPAEWAARYAAKYDLVHREDWTLEKGAELIRELGFEPPFPNKPR